MKLSWTHTYAKKVFSYIRTSKVAGNNKSNFFLKIGVLTILKLAGKMTVISDYVLASSFCVKSST